MSIKKKLLTILVLICLTLSLLCVISVLRYLKQHQHIHFAQASLGDLYAVSNTRSAIISQMTQSIDYLFTGMEKDKKQYKEYELAARNTQAAWVDAVKTSHALGEDESKELERVREVQKNYDELTQIVDSSFALAEGGKIQEAYSVLEGDMSHFLKAILTEKINLSVVEEVREVNNAYEETIIQLGSVLWGSEKGLEQIRVARYFMTYFLIADRALSNMKRQYKELTDYIVGGVEEETREFDEHGREVKTALKDLLIHIQAHSEFTQGKDNNHLKNLIHVGKKHDELIELGYKAFELKRSGKKEEILNIIETRIEPLVNNGLFSLIYYEIEHAKQEIDSANQELLATTFAAGVKAIILLTGMSFIIMFVIINMIRGIIRPLNKLRVGTEIIGSGKLDHRIGLKTKDELGQLAQSFDRMAKSLQDSRNEILFAKEYTDNILCSMNDILVVVSSDGHISMVNDAACILLGYGKDELIGQPVGSIVAGGLSFKELDAEDITANVNLKNVEKTFLTKFGRKVPMLFSSSVMHDKAGEVEGIVCAAQDITERKEAEETLLESERKLRHLASRILTVQEKERRRISLGLHDDLCQSMSLMKIQFGAVKRKIRDDQAPLREECAEIMQGIDLMIENVGRISRDLSPSILENLGLSAAIKRLINDFVKNYDIRMAMDIEDIDNLYDQNIQIILYRIFQESLANIGKHSGAAHVTVTIRNNCNNTFFQLEDDGKGFDLNQVQGKNSTEKGMGLTAMHERARMVGATLDIWSQEGKGTRISLTVPTEKHNIDSRRV